MFYKFDEQPRPFPSLQPNYLNYPRPFAFNRYPHYGYHYHHRYYTYALFALTRKVSSYGPDGALGPLYVYALTFVDSFVPKTRFL